MFVTAAVPQIHEQSSSLAKESSVVEVGLDQVYGLGSDAADENGSSLYFRFMPDAEEVQQALQVKMLPSCLVLCLLLVAYTGCKLHVSNQPVCTRSCVHRFWMIKVDPPQASPGFLYFKQKV